MSERPPIPRELRRRVLVESGHCCAVHTCRHPDVDIHHIEPWARCQEHLYENLIALCPNCHRRAEAGEIDRPSLRMYKARAAASFQFQDSVSAVRKTQTSSTEPSLNSQHWFSAQLTFADETHEVGLEYPQFRGPILGAATAFVNRYVRQCVESELGLFKTAETHSVDPDTSIPHQLHSSFSVGLLRSEIVSVRLSFSAFTGGAHGSHWTEVVNLYVTPIRKIEIIDLFQDGSSGLAALAEYCRERLLDTLQHGFPRDFDHVTRGTEPTVANFKAFNLMPDGLLVTFDEYQVGCYAEGPSEIFVPYGALTAHLMPNLLNVVRSDA